MKNVIHYRLFYNYVRFIITITFICSFISVGGQIVGYKKNNIDDRKIISGFTKLDNKKISLNFGNKIPKSLAFDNSILENGSGVCVGDIDNDGYPDIYLCKIQGENKLFKNLGNWQFKDITRTAGVSFPFSYSMGCVFLDSDNDNDLDLIVTSLGKGVTLMLNDGKGKYTLAKETGLISKYTTHTVAIADIDLDGDLDIYCVNYNSKTIKDNPQTKFNIKIQNNKPKIYQVDNKNIIGTEHEDRFIINDIGQITEFGEPDVLYINNGQNKFSSIIVGESHFNYSDDNQNRQTYYDWGLSAMFGDLNNDGYPDLYVCNDFKTPDRIWFNNKDGTFRGLSKEKIPKMSYYSMGVDFTDINNDGRLDIYVLDMMIADLKNRNLQISSNKSNYKWKDVYKSQYSQNTFLINHKNNYYYDCAITLKTHATDWSWCPLFLDINLDGHEDIIVTNGHLRNALDTDTLLKIEKERTRNKLFTKRQYNKLKEKFKVNNAQNKILINNRNFSFTESSKSMGFDEMNVSHGIASGDLDGDGDQDIIINNANSLCSVYKNNASSPRILIKLTGKKSNTFGIGAKITYVTNTEKFFKEMVCGGRYLSGSESSITFPYINQKNTYIDILWPSGIRQYLYNLIPNKKYTIEESVIKIPKKINKDINMVDYEMKQKIKKKNTNLIYKSNGKPVIQILNSPRHYSILQQQANKLFDSRNIFEITNLTTNSSIKKNYLIKSNTALLTTISNKELLTISYISENNKKYDKLILTNHNNNNQLHLSDITGKIKNLNLFDLDADGDLDIFFLDIEENNLFNFTSHPVMLLNNDGKYKNITENIKIILNSHIVNNAIWADIDNNGYKDLVYTENLGKVGIILNYKGKFKLHPNINKINEMVGLWSCLEINDLNSDGLMDILIGNLGNNNIPSSTYQKIKLILTEITEKNKTPFTFVQETNNKNNYKPLDNYFYYLNKLNKTVNKYPNITSFIESDYNEIIKLLEDTKIKEYEINCTESIMLWNNGTGFDIERFKNNIQTGKLNQIVLDHYTEDNLLDVLYDVNINELSSDWSSKLQFRNFYTQSNRSGAALDFKNLSNNFNTLFKIDDNMYFVDVYNNGKKEVLKFNPYNDLKIFGQKELNNYINVDVSCGYQNPMGVGSKVQLILNNNLKTPIKEISLITNNNTIHGTILSFFIPKGFRAEKVIYQKPGYKFKEINMDSLKGNYLLIQNKM